MLQCEICGDPTVISTRGSDGVDRHVCWGSCLRWPPHPPFIVASTLLRPRFISPEEAQKLEIATK